MASFSTAYSLCALPDQKGFLHAYPGEEDCAVVTLGKNIVISYRLSDQKQLYSWCTVQKLSSKAVYMKETEEYLAVFNGNTVKRWSKQDTSLDKVPRIKLKEPIQEIIPLEEPVVLFKTGACGTLAYCADKNSGPLLGFLSSESVINSAKIIQDEEGQHLIAAAIVEKIPCCYSVKLDGKLQIIPSTLRKIQLKRPGLQLLGSCFVTRNDGAALVTLWSDGFLYLHPLPDLLEDGGRFVGTTQSFVTTSDVAIVAVSAHHVAIYGGDPSEEGAVLAIYNLDFGMAQASTSFKFLQKPPRIWVVHRKLLVGVGQRLVCVPFTLETGKVEALVGTRPVKTSDADLSDIQPIVSTAGWEDGVVAENIGGAPQSLKVIMEELTAQGCSEAGICSTVIRNLIESRDIKNLSWCLENFIDVPEHLCVELVNLALNSEDSVFSGKPGKRKSKTSEKMPQLNGSKEGTDHHSPIHPPERAKFLMKVLNVPISRNGLFAALRTGIRFEDSMILMDFLTHCLSSGFSSKEEYILDWATAVIDAFYQQFVLSNDSSVKDSVAELQNVVNEQFKMVNEMLLVQALLKRIVAGKNLPEKPIQAKSYSIQKLQLYK